MLKKLFRDIGPRYKDRPGGYTRILKQHYRRLGDAGEHGDHRAAQGRRDEGPKKERPTAAPAPAPAGV